MENSFASTHRNQIVRICLNAVFVALYVVLSVFLTVKTPVMEISWASLPILLCAFLFPLQDVCIVAVCGSFFEQLLTYGVNAETVIWMAPVVLQAVFAGVLAWVIRKNPRVWKQIIIIVCAELLLSFANTTALWSFGYVTLDMSSPVLFVLGFVTRTPVAFVRAALSALTIPIILPVLRRHLVSKQVSLNQ